MLQIDRYFDEIDFRCERNYQGDFDRDRDDESVEPCMCGHNLFGRDGTCSLCGSEPRIETFSSSSVHTARKDHTDGKVRKGDRYRKYIAAGYFKDGPRWMETRKVIIKRAEVTA